MCSKILRPPSNNKMEHWSGSMLSNTEATSHIWLLAREMWLVRKDSVSLQRKNVNLHINNFYINEYWNDSTVDILLHNP